MEEKSESAIGWDGGGNGDNVRGRGRRRTGGMGGGSEEKRMHGTAHIKRYEVATNTYLFAASEFVGDDGRPLEPKGEGGARRLLREERVGGKLAEMGLAGARMCRVDGVAEKVLITSELRREVSGLSASASTYPSIRVSVKVTYAEAMPEPRHLPSGINQHSPAVSLLDKPPLSIMPPIPYMKASSNSPQCAPERFNCARDDTGDADVAGAKVLADRLGMGQGRRRGQWGTQSWSALLGSEGGGLVGLRQWMAATIPILAMGLAHLAATVWYLDGHMSSRSTMTSTVKSRRREKKRKMRERKRRKGWRGQRQGVLRERDSRDSIAFRSLARLEYIPKVRPWG
ncbi:hypothetical protein DFH06DRAFT_1296276 [Mycena polygramma]|nr:hypothetical protein DFH06DRAFT_1296276 [Mycena polygramma]